MMLSRLPLLSQSRARAARRDTCTLNSVKSCPQVLDTFRIVIGFPPAKLYACPLARSDVARRSNARTASVM